MWCSIRESRLMTLPNPRISIPEIIEATAATVPLLKSCQVPTVAMNPPMMVIHPTAHMRTAILRVSGWSGGAAVVSANSVGAGGAGGGSGFRKGLIARGYHARYYSSSPWQVLDMALDHRRYS